MFNIFIAPTFPFHIYFSVMDPIQMLIDGAVQHEVLQNKNPYLTMETLILRLYNSIHQHTRVEYNTCDKTILFSRWHEEILNDYESIKSKMPIEDRASVERVLSKDCPHPAELAKFACCWYKHNPKQVCYWFAVDGILGSHPKTYAQDAFSLKFDKHNAAVRALYNYYSNPENIKEIVLKALSIEKDGPLESDPDFDMCVGMYAEMVGNDEMAKIAADRRLKLQMQQQPNKRKRKSHSNDDASQTTLDSVKRKKKHTLKAVSNEPSQILSSPENFIQPISPPDSPQDL